MWKIQSNHQNKWDDAKPWQVYMINQKITTKSNFYAKYKYNKTEYIYICTHDTPGKIRLWNLNTDTERIVIHSDYGNPNHNGPEKGGGMSIDHLVIANGQTLEDLSSLR